MIMIMQVYTVLEWLCLVCYSPIRWLLLLFWRKGKEKVLVQCWMYKQDFRLQRVIVAASLVTHNRGLVIWTLGQSHTAKRILRCILILSPRDVAMLARSWEARFCPRPSVHHTGALWQNEITNCRYSDTSLKGSLVYRHQESNIIRGRRCLHQKIALEVTHLLRKTPTSTDFHW